MWNRVREELRSDVADFTFHIWLDPLRLAAVRDTAVYVRAPDHIRTWVRDRYSAQLQAAVRRGFRPDATVEVVPVDWEPGPTDGPPSPAEASGPEQRPLIAKYTFEQFVIGRGNRFAHAAALAVAEQPGHAYNPLFIHGRPGLGKTHLLHAVGNYIGRHEPGMQVRYATVEEFTNEFVRAIKARDMTAFKNSFREVDVLLLDDVQFLAEKARTEEELFHTFNALRDSGKQLVMTSDRPPDELQSLEQRLGERFGSGLVVSIDPPDIHVRRAILEKRARLDDVAADPDAARGDRRPCQHERPRPRGRADPGRGLRLAARRAPDGRAGPPAPEEDRPHPERPLHRAHDRPGRRRRLRGHARTARGPRSPARRRPGPEGRHVPRPRADRPEPSRDRPRFRRARPLHRPLRRP